MQRSGFALTNSAVSSPRMPAASYSAILRATALWAIVAVLGAVAWFVAVDHFRAVLLLAALSLALLAMATTVMAVAYRLQRYFAGRALSALVRHDPAPAFVSDSDGTTVLINPAARSDLGAQAGQPVGEILAHHASEPLRLAQTLCGAALRDGCAQHAINGATGGLTLTAIRYDAMTVIWRLLPEVAAHVPAVVPPVPEPVTQTVAADDEFDALPVPILRIDHSGVITSASHRARQLMDDEAIVGRHLSQVVEGLGRPIREWLGDAMEGRGVLRPEIARTKAGARDLYLQITLDRVEVGTQTHLIAVLHDATELKTLEAQFVQSQKMQAVGQLAGGVAHDFNNLLTAISGHCDLLLLRRDHADPDFADLEQINQNANRAASLVGQLLAFSRKQNLRPEFLDLRHTLADLTHLLNRLVGERVHLTFTHDPALQLIRADKRQLEQVIMNLVVNARDAMPAGGEIRIVTGVETLAAPSRRDRVELPAGAYVTVRVHDEGTGITPDQMHKGTSKNCPERAAAV